jgi:hypothetical protein
MARFVIAWFALIAVPLVQSAEAQVVAPAMSPKTSQPSDPRAAVPPTTYRSAFSGYRTSSDDTVIPWHEANEVVGRIGGWRVYAREAPQPAAPVQAPGARGTPAPHKN